ncbi:hypothetical protein ES708_02599 [subsurface metagenome]
MSKIIKLEERVYNQLDQLRGNRETFSNVVTKLLTTKEGFDTMFQLWYGPKTESEVKHRPERIRDLQVR